METETPPHGLYHHRVPEEGPDNRSKGQGKKHALDGRIQLRAGEAGSEKKKFEFVPKEVWDKRTIEGRCMKCRRSNHQSRDYKAPSRAKTSTYLGNANQEPVQKKRRFNRVHHKITRHGSEEHSGNK